MDFGGCDQHLGKSAGGGGSVVDGVGPFSTSLIYGLHRV